MPVKYQYVMTFFIVSCLLMAGCGKSFLNPKPNSSIINPTSIQDYQNLLENDEYVNAVGSGLSQLSADEYYFMDYDAWQSTYSATERQAYIWAKDVFGGETNIQDWNAPYKAIFYANVVISGLSSLQDSIGSSKYDFVLGWAYFVRAFNLFGLVRDFSPAYDSSTANTDLGVPIRLSPNIDAIETRSSLQATFQQIFSDLDRSLRLLSSEQYEMAYPNHPSKAAVYALRARICLYVRQYNEAGLNADSSLALHNILLDYNTLSTSATRPFSSTTNNEVLYSASQVVAYPTTCVASNARKISIDTNLLAMYSANDIRRTVFFRNGNFSNIYMKGSYVGIGLYGFSGLAVDEMYLIRAEYYARSNKVDLAVSDLNTLLQQRYTTGTYKPLISDTITNILQLVLNERRKELIWRGLRWSDLKRLNKEDAGITLTRILNGQVYTLEPNDSRYVFNIPSDEITQSGITQNER